MGVNHQDDQNDRKGSRLTNTAMDRPSQASQESSPPEQVGDVADLAQPEIEQLVAQYHAAVYRYAFRLCRSSNDAEDLTQQTFLIAQQKLHQLRESNRAGGWLYAIARSCFLKSIRRNQPMLAGDLAVEVSEVPQVADTLSAIDTDELQVALNQLPDDQRLVVTMFYFEHASYKEIAEAIDSPVGTVMSRLSRAKGRLRQLLVEFEDDSPVEHPRQAK